jgi:hypothetical protein
MKGELCDDEEEEKQDNPQIMSLLRGLQRRRKMRRMLWPKISLKKGRAFGSTTIFGLLVLLVGRHLAPS